MPEGCRETLHPRQIGEGSRGVFTQRVLRNGQVEKPEPMSPRTVYCGPETSFLSAEAGAGDWLRAQPKGLNRRRGKE